MTKPIFLKGKYFSRMAFLLAGFLGLFLIPSLPAIGAKNIDDFDGEFLEVDDAELEAALQSLEEKPEPEPVRPARAIAKPPAPAVVVPPVKAAQERPAAPRQVETTAPVTAKAAVPAPPPVIYKAPAPPPVIYKAPVPQKKTAAEVKKYGKEEDYYSFIANLQEAEALLMDPELEEPIEARWIGDHYLFGVSGRGRISAAKAQPLPGQTLDVLSVQMESGKTQVLRFYNLPPASKINLRYYLKESNPGKDSKFMYVRVLAGKKLLRHIQVSTQDDWKKLQLDLGVVPMLNREIAVTFQFICPEAQGLTLFLAPEVLP